MKEQSKNEDDEPRMRRSVSDESLNCFFIVGAPRCGTSAMASYLRRHPSICFSSPKETNFFIAPAKETAPKAMKKRFLKAFFSPEEGQTTLLGEGSVSTLYSADAIRRMDACFPEAKFIVMLRSPVEMIHSYHARLLYMRQETEEDFETAWNLQEARSAGRQIPKSCFDSRMLQYREVGSLGRYTAQLFDLVGRERCHAIIYDDFSADTLTAYRNTLAFLDLPDDKRTKLRRKNQNKTYRSGFIQALYGGAVLGPIAKMLARHPERLARVARLTRPIRKKFMSVNKVNAERSPLSPALEHRLRAVFREDIEQLSQIMQRDLKNWTDDSTSEVDDRQPAVTDPAFVTKS
jgi:hypothetical protein